MSMTWQEQTKWPDTSKDNVAWAMAKLRLPLDASVSEIAALAQKIKEEEL